MPEGRSAVASEPDGWGRARWRLRDLTTRERWFAFALLVLVLVPFAVALIRSFRDGWVASGDEGHIAISAWDVFSRHPPLTGLPSTSELYGRNIEANHPGPFEFYLLAVPLRVLGLSAGPLFTAATINATCVLLALWAFFRRLGSTMTLWAGVVILAVIWSAGTAVLVDTLSSNMTTYSLLATAALAWAVVDGDLALLPLTVLVASYAAQQHLAAGLVVVVLAGLVIVALAIQIVIRVRRGEAVLDRTARRWSLVAAAVAAVCWVTVLIDEVTGHPGNLTAILRFARDNTRPTLGFKSAIYQAVHGVAPPTVLTRTDTLGPYFLPSPGTLRIALGILVVIALVALATRARRRSRGLANLALVALVFIAAGIIDGSNVPASVEASRVNLYRWTWTAALLTVTALGAGAALIVGHVAGRLPIAERARRLTPFALLTAAALIVTSIAFVGGRDDHNRDRPAFAAEKQIAAKVLARVDRRKPVAVISFGWSATLAVGPYLILRLIDAGVPVEVSKYYTSADGSRRRYHPSPDTSVIVVLSGDKKMPAEPGELIAKPRFSPPRSALLDELSAAALGKKVELAPGARAFLDRKFTGLSLLIINALLEKLSTSPREVFETPEFVQLLLDHRLLRSPVLDRTKLQRLLDLPENTHTIGPDEGVEVRFLRPDQVRAARLSGL